MITLIWICYVILSVIVGMIVVRENIEEGTGNSSRYLGFMFFVGLIFMPIIVIFGTIDLVFCVVGSFFKKVL